MARLRDDARRRCVVPPGFFARRFAPLELRRAFVFGAAATPPSAAGAAARSPSSDAPSISAAFSFAAFAASRSARLRYISSMEGQSSLKQSFQGRPGLNFWATETRGVRPQTVQISSSLWTS